MGKNYSYHLDLAPESTWNIISATAVSKNVLLYLQENGDFYAGPQYFTIREGFASYFIQITLEGCGIVQYRGSSMRMTPGKFLWMDCVNHHQYYTEPHTGRWHVMWVHFNGPSAQFFYDTFLKLNNGSCVGTLFPGSPAYGVMETLVRMDNSDNQQEADFIANNLLTQLVTAAITSIAGAAGTSRVPEHIEQIRQYIQQHYNEKLTLEHLGAQFNINPYHMQKQFKKYVGQSPTEYQIYLRMIRIKELIRTTEMSMGEIAYEVGIDNLSYFSRLFKKHEGITPQKYREIQPVMSAAALDL